MTSRPIVKFASKNLEIGSKIGLQSINEPYIISYFGYDLGLAAPGRCSLPGPPGPCPAGNSSTEPYIVAHNLLLAHTAAARLYKNKFQVRNSPPFSMT